MIYLYILLISPIKINELIVNKYLLDSLYAKKTLINQRNQFH